MPSRSRLKICSDFDNTIISKNLAVELIKHYLLHGKHEFFLHRWLRAVPLLSQTIRRKHFGIFYDVVRRVPLETRNAIIADMEVNPEWLEQVRMLRLKHQSPQVELTIISRNCVDFVKGWVLMHGALLAEHGIEVHAIIANKPLSDHKDEFVQETEHFHHIDRAGAGTLQEEGKRKFVKNVIYLGDIEEEVLENSVKEFVRV